MPLLQAPYVDSLVRWSLADLALLKSPNRQKDLKSESMFGKVNTGYSLGDKSDKLSTNFLSRDSVGTKQVALDLCERETDGCRSAPFTEPCLDSMQIASSVSLLAALYRPRTMIIVCAVIALLACTRLVGPNLPVQCAWSRR